MLILMRIIHVLSGVAWAGGVFMMASLVEPSARGTGPEGGKFMQYLAGPGKLPIYMTTSGLLSVLSGLYLMWVRSGGFNGEWFGTGQGIALSIGATAGILSAVIGNIMPRKARTEMARIGQQIQAAGGPPSPALLAELNVQRERLAQAGRITALLLVIAVIGMSLNGYV